MKKNISFRGSLLKVVAFAAVIAIASCSKSDNLVSEDFVSKDLSASAAGSENSAKILAYANEVRSNGSGSFIWRTDGVDRGTTSSLSTAIKNCMRPNTDVDILVGGNLSEPIVIPGVSVRLWCHNQTFYRNFSGNGLTNIHNGLEVHNMIMRDGSNGYGIRSSRASNLKFNNVKIYNSPWISMRIDSRESNPWSYWISNLTVTNCTFDGGGGHGLETYGIDGVNIQGIVARNKAECGVLLNQTKNGTVGTIDAYRCATNTGYAGYRLANTCSNITADMLYANECGRGYFVLSGSNNNTLKNCRITNGTGIGVWLENVVNCKVLAGCTNDGVSVTGSGSYANVSTGGCP